MLGALVVLAVVAVPAAGAADYDTTPLLDVGGSSHALGAPSYVYLDAYHLDAVAPVERIAFGTAVGFAFTLPTHVGDSLGEAYIDAVPAAGSTNDVEFDGDLTVMDPAAYAADPAAQACAPGAHAGTWQMHMADDDDRPLNIAVAVDAAANGTYTLTACLDALSAFKLMPAEIYLDADGVFTNATTTGRYVFNAVVTPYGADGLPNPTAGYEIRGYDDLPQTLTATAKYATATKIFTVTGTLQAKGAPRGAINVHIYVGQTSNPLTMHEAGYAVTDSAGRYTYTTRLATAPRYATGFVNHYWGPDCTGSTTPPAGTAGCVSHTINGVGTAIGAVQTIKPKPKPKPKPKKKP